LSSREYLFQAEDGIRDFHVTGVQTCALPVSATAARAASIAQVAERPELFDQLLIAVLADLPVGREGKRAAPGAQLVLHRPEPLRSEERRVGNEWRAGCALLAGGDTARRRMT